MSDVSENIKRLRENFLTKEQALEKVASFENCSELLFSGKSNFTFHPVLDKHYILSGKGDKEFVLNNATFVKLCRLVGVSHTYVNKVPHELLFPHLSYWLDTGGVNVKAFIREVADKDGRQPITGFAREEAYYYPISRILEKVDKVNPDYVLEDFDDITWRHSTFGVVFPSFEFEVEKQDEVQKGDVLYGGIKVQNSLLGEIPFKISAFLLTLACLNGVVSVDEVYTFNRKQGFEGEDAWIGDAIQQAFGALSSEVDKVKRLTQISVTPEEISPYVTFAFNEMGINQKSREVVLTSVVEKNPHNLYQLMNAVTAAAHVIENRQEVYSLQRLGGFVASHAESCSKCKRPF